jgi:hypothetical protein
MMRYLTATCCVLIALSALCAVNLSAEAPKEGGESFKGKLVLVYFKGRTADHAFTLENVEFTELNGSKMIKGVHADTGEEGDWMQGRKTLVAWDSIESLTLYDNVDDYKKAVAPFDDDTL